MTKKALRFGVLLLLLASVVAWSPPKPFAPPATTEHRAPYFEKALRKAVATATFLLISLPAFAMDQPTTSRRYWTIMGEGGTPQERVMANEALLDHAVGTINIMYYDNSGGANFVPREFYEQWRRMRDAARNPKAQPNVPFTLESREGAVQGLKWLVSTLNDPYSKYLTREELRNEPNESNDGFLGLGAVVKPPQDTLFRVPSGPKTSGSLMSTTRADNLPVVTAVAPNSPAERAGVTVGDRIVAVGSDKFMGQSRSDVTRKLKKRYSAENYAGLADVTLAKPVLQEEGNRQVVMGYRLSRLKLSTTFNAPFRVPFGVSGDSLVQYKLLKSSDSILDQSSSDVGYIRLTRFSHSATTRFFHAIDELEAAGAKSYIIDLRNNYGGVIQEAMLTASTLLRDPHAVLCYTMNSRGGFTPHDAEEYILDTRYPGYLLSREPSTVAVNQVRREHPEFYQQDELTWAAPSSYASLHEQTMTRGIHRSPMMDGPKQWNAGWMPRSNSVRDQHRMQKKIVLLVNEGTASSAEVFASALHDNGRTVALVGAKTYGKGLIQHTFPMPDGGGLRLTVAEYLTPSLHHVTHVGSARYDRTTGDWVGGGIQPDIMCESKRGISTNVGADFCVGMALDALEEAELQDSYVASGDEALLNQVGGTRDEFIPRRPVTAGLMRVSARSFSQALQVFKSFLIIKTSFAFLFYSQDDF